MPWLKLEWEKLGWINIGSAVASFPWPGLPPDVHFSVSYNSESDSMNIHLTRNAPGVPPENKPYIRIAEWPRAEAEEMAKMLFARYWYHMWEPFNMATYQYPPSSKGQEARYCSITGLQKQGNKSVIHRQVKEHFLKHLMRKRNGRHLIMQKELTPAMEALVRQPGFFWTLMDQFGRVPRKFFRATEFGCLHAKDFTGLVLRVQGQWFTFRKDANFDPIFQDFFEPDGYEDLKNTISEAIECIAKATTKADTRSFGEPINLFIVRR